MAEQRRKTLEELYREAFELKRHDKDEGFDHDTSYDDEWDDDDADCIWD